MGMLSGQTFKGYEIHESIGQGAFGAVYRAHQTVVDREVAIKVILPQYANQPDFIRRFETEAQLVARLEHLHIVPLYDYWRDPDGAYLVMRYLRGGSLKDWIGQGALDPGETLRLVEQIAQALAVAHRHGVVHRDIKPSNILLDEERNAYLADFGIAKVVGGEPSVEGLRGTLDYISPEQIRSQPVTAQTDVYALGIVLYEMLSGAQPFSPSSTPAELLHKHLETPVPDLQTKRDGLSVAVNEVIQTATAKTPIDRYSDAPELARALREALAVAELAPAVIEQPLIEALTDRELDVLRLMAEGFSHGEIAQKLVLAVTTVKWYAQEIYGKLGVSGRRQAVAVGQRLGLLEGAAGRRDVALPEWLVGHNPYKGLAAFQQADAPDFFGREALVEQLVSRLQEHDNLARFLAVVGPSGSGKSSVVRAGLLPALKQGAVTGSEKWFVVGMLPGGRPLDKLEVALGRIAAQHLPGIMEQLQRDAYGLVRIADLILPEDDQLLLVIDQFEELFTLVADPAITRHVLDLIYAAVTDSRSPVRVIITLRADFYDRPLMYPDFFDLMRYRTEVVGPLTPEELEQAIVKPAEMAGVTVEPGLVAALVAEVHEQPGTLPLLEYALTGLFEQRQGRTMTLAAYQALGGALGVLTRQADAVYDDLSDTEQDTARQVFLRLVTLGEGTEDIRRRVLLSELSAISNSQNAMEEVLRLFGEYRLLTFDFDPATREPTVEVAHEALIQRWGKLRDWLDAGRADIRQQRLLAAAAAEWEQAGRENSYLLSGLRLAQFEDWAARTDLALTPGEYMFLETSVTEQTRQRDKAEHQAAVNRSLVLANAAAKLADTEGPGYALPLALEAMNMERPPNEAVSTLQDIALKAGTRSIIRNKGNAIKAVAFSPDSRLGLSGGCETLDSGVCTQGELILWDLETKTEVRRFEGHTDWINDVAFSADGKTILSGSDDQTLILWDVSTGAIIRRFEGHTGGVKSIALSPDGRIAISGAADGTLRIWDVNSGDTLFQLVGEAASVNQVALSPDGKMVASFTDKAVIILWDTATGQEIRRLTGHTGSISALAFRPLTTGGYTLLSIATDQRLVEWDVTTGQISRQFAVAAMTYRLPVSPDGRTVVILYPAGVYMFNAEQFQPSEILDEHFGPAEAGAVSLDGRFILLGHSNGVVRLCDMPVTDEVRRFEADVPLVSADVSPDGRYLITGSFTGGVAILWDLQTGQEIRRFEGQGDTLWQVKFSPDGRLAALGSSTMSGTSETHELVLVNVETGLEVHRLEGHKLGPVHNIVFSPDGRYLLTGSMQWTPDWPKPGGGDLILWDVETGAIVRRFEETRSVMGIAFNADGSQALTSSSMAGLYVSLWNVNTGQLLRRFYDWPDIQQPNAPLWEPDGIHVLVSGQGKIAEMNIQTGQVTRVLDSHSAYPIMFTDHSPDWRYVVGSDLIGGLTVWDFATGEEIRHITAYNAPGWSVVFNPNGQTVFTSSIGAKPVIEWQVADWPLDKLLTWVHENRYIREFTCAERAQYRIEPLCK